MKYEEQLDDSLTETQMYRLIVAGLRADVNKLKPIFVGMSYEKLGEIIDNSMRTRPTSEVGCVEYESPIGLVYLLGTTDKTNLITVQN